MQRFRLEDLPHAIRELNKLPGAGASSAPSIPSTATAGRQPPARESELQQLCENELRRRRIAFLHLSPRAREKEGWPDLVFAVYGKATAVELKTSVGRLSEAQEQLHRELRASGWDVFVFRSFEPFHVLVRGITIED
jgi:hypothetical protein